MNFKSNVKIDGINIGHNSKPYVIAEVSGNHGGDLDKALELIKAAAKAGASAVKIQTYTADTMTINSDRPEFMINDPKSIWNGKTLYELYQDASTPWEWHKSLFKEAKKNKITIFSSPFDVTAVDFLESLNVSCYKIASFEITDLRLIEKIAKTKKPVILSTGTATLSEISRAVEVLNNYGCDELVLLVCVSLYPAPAELVQLNRINTLKSMFNVPVGLSDHSFGLTVPITSIGAGACVVEKHFKMNETDITVDSEFSISASELKKLCEATEYAHLSMQGHGDWGEKDDFSRLYRRSLYFVSNIKKGSVVTKENIKAIRPSLGIDTHHFDSVVGMKAVCDIKFGTPVSWKLLK